MKNLNKNGSEANLGEMKYLGDNDTAVIIIELFFNSNLAFKLLPIVNSIIKKLFFSKRISFSKYKSHHLLN